MQSIKVHQVSKYWLLLTLQKLRRLLCFSFYMQNMQSTVFTLNVLVGNCTSTCNVHIQKHFSKKQISFFSFTVYYRRYSRNTVYNMIEQNRFYSIAYSEQNIHETHKSILNKETTAKSPDKKGGGGTTVKKSTKLLYLISAIFRVRPHVFINMASDIIQGDAPGIKPLGMSDPPLEIINCDVPAASIHGFKEGHLVMWLMVINLPPPRILTPPPCPLFGPALLPGPLALTLPRPDITVFFFSVSKNITPQSPPLTVTPATESKPDWNQL